MSTMRETVLRYEDPAKNNQVKRLAEMKCKEANEKLRHLQEYVRLLHGEWKQCLRADLLNNAGRKIVQKITDNVVNQSEAEARQGAKAAIRLRRRALEVQLQREMTQYNKELAAVGKTFYSERI